MKMKTDFILKILFAAALFLVTATVQAFTIPFTDIEINFSSEPSQHISPSPRIKNLVSCYSSLLKLRNGPKIFIMTPQEIRKAANDPKGFVTEALYDNNKIYVTSYVSAHIVAHELRHHWQHTRGLLNMSQFQYRYENRPTEIDAENWAISNAHRCKGGKSRPFAERPTFKRSTNAKPSYQPKATKDRMLYAGACNKTHRVKPNETWWKLSTIYAGSMDKRSWIRSVQKKNLNNTLKFDFFACVKW